MVIKFLSSLNSGHLCRSLVGLRGGCTVALFCDTQGCSWSSLRASVGFFPADQCNLADGIDHREEFERGKCLILQDQDHCQSLQPQCSRAISFTAQSSISRSPQGSSLKWSFCYLMAPSIQGGETYSSSSTYFSGKIAGPLHNQPEFNPSGVFF